MKKDLGLYIHIPFCVQKCGYCDFLSWKGTKEEQEAYVAALEKEIRSYREFAKGYRVSTVFLGGGTPSVLECGQIEAVFQAIGETFELERRPEITIEANPGTITPEKLAVWRRCGINRLSMGVQSADNANLKMLGRIHTWEQFLEGLSQAREAGFDNISADLISSIPGQTAQTWKKELETLADQQLEHISVYQLILEEGTRFYEKYAGHPELLPNDEESREIYLSTGRILKEYGLEQYEISNYAKPGKESRHNLKYWERADYLGLGLGASSMVRNIRMDNTRDMEQYLAKCGNPKTMREHVEFLEEPRQMEEFMFLGLRKMEGISRRRFREEFQTEMEEIYGTVIEELCRQGLLETAGDRLRLTRKGIDVSNYVMSEFLLDGE